MPGMALKIGARFDGENAVLDLEGRLWILDLPLRDLIHSLIEQGRRFFVLNIENVDYVDSSGLGQMVSIWTSVRNKGGNVVVLKPNKRIMNLLTITRLHIVFDIFDDEARATGSVRR